MVLQKEKELLEKIYEDNRLKRMEYNFDFNNYYNFFIISLNR